MMDAIKTEFRKLLTVRSTYFIAAIALALNTFFAFYVEGMRAGSSIHNSSKLAGEVLNSISATSIFIALLALLLMAHEYRYNTIAYTMTSSNSRTRTLLAKILTVSIMGIVFSIFVAAYAPLMTLLGLKLKGLSLDHQVFHVGNLLWRTVFVGWGYGMVGLLLATLLRNQIAAVVSLFIVPTTVESIATLLLKTNSVYLPFSSLQQVVNQAGPGVSAGSSFGGYLAPGKAALVFLAYMVIGWLITWYLFLKRDAN